MTVTFRQKLSDGLHLWKALTRRYHTQLGPIFRADVPADGVVFDVGAHAGQFTKLFSEMVPEGRVFSFEPSACSRRVPQTVIGIKGLDNVCVLPCGLSDHPRPELVHKPLNDRGSLSYGLAIIGATAGSRRQLLSAPVSRHQYTTVSALGARPCVPSRRRRSAAKENPRPQRIGLYGALLREIRILGRTAMNRRNTKAIAQAP